MLSLAIESKTQFLTSLERITSEATTISHHEMMSALKSVPESNFTAEECHKLVDFALDQICQWQVKWLFSSAQAPDATAQTEADAWEHLWDEFSEPLVKFIPEIQAPLREKKDMSIAHRLLQRKVRQDAGNRTARFASAVLGRVAITLNAFGCKGIARKLYARALYPAGTVGRAQ